MCCQAWCPLSHYSRPPLLLFLPPPSHARRRPPPPPPCFPASPPARRRQAPPQRRRLLPAPRILLHPRRRHLRAVPVLQGGLAGASLGICERARRVWGGGMPRRCTRGANPGSCALLPPPAPRRALVRSFMHASSRTHQAVVHACVHALVHAFLAAQDAGEMAQALKDRCPSKIDIGPVYNVDPQRRAAYQGAQGTWPLIASAWQGEARRAAWARDGPVQPRPSGGPGRSLG